MMMYWMHIIVFFLLINNVESRKLISNKHISRLQNSFPESKITTRQSHKCYASCAFILYFNASLIVPDECNKNDTVRACEMELTIFYKEQYMLVYFYNSPSSLTIENITYQSIALHLADFEFNDNTTIHIVDYTCGTGDFCEWEYMKKIIPELIKFDYQLLYNSLLTQVSDSNGQQNIVECYKDSEIINCTSGGCLFFQSLDNYYNISITRGCAFTHMTSVSMGKVRFSPGPAKHDYVIMDFVCNKDKCNDQSNEDVIRKIISSQGNDYIIDRSLGTKLRLTSFILSFIFIHTLI